MYSAEDQSLGATSPTISSPPDDEGNEEDLPQCKIKRNYSCNLCPFFSQNPRSFLYHSRDVHYDKIKIYECSQCLYASKHSQKLQRHINMIHVPGKERSSKKEVVRKPPIEKQIIKEEMVVTPIIVDGAVVGIEEDDQTDEQLMDVKCSVCSYTSRSATLMRRHERVVHLKKRFLRCSKCSYVTHVKARFTKHVKYHSMPMIKCDLCDFRTPYKWNLDRHYKNHCGSGAFQCSKCNFRADIKQSLTVHEMNHHVPPVGAGAAILMRKRNKVGASETLAMESDGIDYEELELLRMERENDDGKDFAESDGEEPDLNAEIGSKLQSALQRPFPAKKSMSRGIASFSPVKPPQSLSKPHKCKLCNYRAAYPAEVTRHENRVHGVVRDRRPPPNLIPIQGKPNSPTLNQFDEPTPPVSEEEFNEMCKKSSLTSSLKQIVSLIGDEEALKTIPDPCKEEDVPDDVSEEEEDHIKKSHTDLLKRKNALFFDKIKEKLSNGVSEDGQLVCETCGLKSKDVPEALAHEKVHKKTMEDRVATSSELSSTRCQHCRQRCKTSSDLVNHLQVCSVYLAACSSQQEPMQVDDDDDDDEYGGENRVFIWNDLPSPEDDGEEEDDFNLLSEPPVECVVELSEPPQRQGLAPRPQHIVVRKPPQPSMKKVFKCPHCSFWASTASRFHVHIVGHLNKKPFECSLCSYRSNWRWDITKHIRLKSARDPSHTHATVNMTDETGRRNYSKYNKYLTMMKVSEPSADSSGSGRRTRPCDATQGMVGEEDILHPIPALPQLTPAPSSVTAGSSATSKTATIRPPPLLQAANSAGSSKRTLWKCKKCHYRNSDKEKVLAHVKSHYGANGQTETDEEDFEMGQADDEPMARNAYKCGHCQHISNWKHVIQRHCRFMHDGDVKIEDCTEDDLGRPSLDHPMGTDDPQSERDPSEPYACDLCPFSAETVGDLTAHKLNHVDRPGSIFKCTYCPFYVPSKKAVLEHMEIHGIENSEDISSLVIDNFDPSECENEVKEGDAEGSKRYRCRQCPYVSNSKTQFLYHKQFHRPRDAPFKCMYCSYNVSRRHLLHQHLRVHHFYKTSQGTEDDMPGIPLVWVNRSGTYLKMYKCRWCPHVNQRRINIQEHEKMHRDAFKLRCPDCNYTCNNPGVLSSHIKVHSSCYGEIKSLVDPTRSDADQIKTLEEEAAENMDESMDLEKGLNEESHEVNMEHSTPENSYYQSTTVDEDGLAKDDFHSKLISFCSKCPARFFHINEFRIHAKFHQLVTLPFKCDFCSYTARQRPHLLAHLKVHSQEYQEKTACLVDSYMVSPDHPQPKTEMVAKESPNMAGPIWSVTGFVNSVIHVKPPKALPKHACSRCPAKFFKPVALQYHLTLHGGEHQHRCKYCDYTVKTYGNLIKHQFIHENAERKANGLPPIQTELEEQKAAKSQLKRTDPQFGDQMHGSPDFIYPMYVKNGKLKEKRYKCHKCPSAFEKRDQYRIHLSLHGSKQKYKCEKCDYSVKYSANYIQHMKKHQHNEEAKLAQDGQMKDLENGFDEDMPTQYVPPPLTMLEKQTLLLERKRRCIKDEERKGFYCDLCPYSNLRRDCLENHERRHFANSGVRYGFECIHCDYSATQSNFLREHMKLHVKPPAPRYTPEAFLKADHIELWAKEEDAPENSSWLIFKNNEGSEEPFLPPLPHLEEPEEEKDEEKVFVDPKTGETLNEGEDIVADLDPDLLASSMSPPSSPGVLEVDGEDLIELVEDNPEESKPKPKRQRGKNWRCTKCPHAFGKRDLFERHAALHGSSQKYSCDICDYSVKFYTNYVQHMRMHQSHEPDCVIEIQPYVASPNRGYAIEETAIDSSVIPVTDEMEPYDDMIAEEEESVPDDLVDDEALEDEQGAVERAMLSTDTNDSSLPPSSDDDDDDGTEMHTGIDI